MKVTTFINITVNAFKSMERQYTYFKVSEIFIICLKLYIPVINGGRMYDFECVYMCMCV